MLGVRSQTCRLRQILCSRGRKPFCGSCPWTASSCEFGLRPYAWGPGMSCLCPWTEGVLTPASAPTPSLCSSEPGTTLQPDWGRAGRPLVSAAPALHGRGGITPEQRSHQVPRPDLGTPGFVGQSRPHVPKRRVLCSLSGRAQILGLTSPSSRGLSFPSGKRSRVDAQRRGVWESAGPLSLMGPSGLGASLAHVAPTPPGAGGRPRSQSKAG